MSIEEIFQTMRELVAEQFALEPEEVTMDTAFEEDLGADSVDLVELVMAIEEEFEVGEIQEEDLSGLKTVGDTVNYIASKGEVNGEHPACVRGFLLERTNMVELEKKLNYTFRNPALLEEALSHSSLCQ